MTPEKNGEIAVNFGDEVVRGATVTKGGAITWPPPAPKLSAAPKAKPAMDKTSSVSLPVDEKLVNPIAKWAPFIVGGLAIFGLGASAPSSFISHLTVFVLACFVGYMVIWNVKPSLHTPLMSVTNAISSIIIIGALLQISMPDPWVMWLAGIAVLITSINIVGGFAVTRRMLSMFQK
jgi:H+-translocating NAD(P) transhydrogenase subunit alpha